MNSTPDNLTTSAMQFGDLLANYVPRILVAIVILGLTLIASRRLEQFTRAALTRARLPAGATGLISSVSNFIVIVIGLIFVFQALGLSQAVYGAIASLGIIGLIVGFALQDVTRQFAAGVMLLVASPFQVGDTVKIGDHEGTVVDIQLRATVLKTADSDEVLIPNADVYTATIVNTSRYGLRRHTLRFALPPAADFTTVRTSLARVATEAPGVAANPAPAVVLLPTGEGQVSAELRYWIDPRRPDADDIATQVTIAAHHALAGAATGGSEAG